MNLTKKAQAIKDEFCPALGLRGVLSVGLELFDKLDGKEKINRVVRALAEDRAGYIAAAEDEAAAAADTIKKRRNRGRRKSSKAG